MDIQVGLRGRAETVVAAENTAKTMGSGSLDVFATPAMVALMEEAAVNALALTHDDEHSSVGTSLDIRHLSATPIGLKVWAEAELIAVDRKMLVFNIEVYDEIEKIGDGRHERFIINNKKFMIKTEGKLKRR